jgi:hypothetical protein
MNTLPGWIIDIGDRELQGWFVKVWRRLPGYVRPALTVDAPAAFLVDTLPDGKRARVGVEINHQTRQTRLVLHVTRGLLSCRPEQIRGTLAHELAHIYLRHFDQLLTNDPAPPPGVQKWHEWHANFVVRHLWGFEDDWQALHKGG